MESYVYQSAVSKKRFAFLLHFDDAATRAHQKVDDKLDPVRTIQNNFIKNCANNYNLFSALTVDESLLAFRGKCLFSKYFLNKPAKYHLRLGMMCDVKYKFMVNAILYLEKFADRVPHLQQFLHQRADKNIL